MQEPDIVAMARASEKDERLSVGALFGELAAEIERLEAEVAEWKERWAAERRDHETTIRQFDELMNEDVR